MMIDTAEIAFSTNRFTVNICIVVFAKILGYVMATRPGYNMCQPEQTTPRIRLNISHRMNKTGKNKRLRWPTFVLFGSRSRVSIASPSPSSQSPAPAPVLLALAHSNDIETGGLDLSWVPERVTNANDK